MYLKRLVLIAGILFITSAGDLLAMHDGDSDGDEHTVVVRSGSASPALSTGSARSTASDSSARFREIIAPLVSAVATLSAQFSTWAESQMPSGALAASGGSSPRASMSAGASNAGFGSGGGGYIDHSQAYLAAQVSKLNIGVQQVLALLQDRAATQSIGSGSKSPTKPIVFGGVEGHPFGSVKPGPRVAVAQDLVDDGYAGTVVYRSTPVVIGGVNGHPFGAVKAPDACASAIISVQRVSPISFSGVKDK